MSELRLAVSALDSERSLLKEVTAVFLRSALHAELGRGDGMEESAQLDGALGRTRPKIAFALASIP